MNSSRLLELRELEAEATVVYNDALENLKVAADVFGKATDNLERIRRMISETESTIKES